MDMGVPNVYSNPNKTAIKTVRYVHNDLQRVFSEGPFLSRTDTTPRSHPAPPVLRWVFSHPVAAQAADTYKPELGSGWARSLYPASAGLGRAAPAAP